MNNRSGLLHEISLALSLVPPADTTAELKKRLKVPEQFRDLRRIKDLEAFLEWCQTNKPRANLGDKAWQRKSKLSNEQIFAAWREAPYHGTKTRIASEAGVSDRRVGQIIKKHSNKGAQHDRDD